MGKRKLRSIDKLELRLWKCASCKGLECEIVSYKRPIGCNLPSDRQEDVFPDWKLREVLK
ncbi:MAG: hypothetical protein OEV21_00545 [Thermoplasmata archaeon]|nr:hypothetical protein [Thermoplasmata archaeon]